ncbi:hypothetical protein [Sinorhizobium meliloti]|uniref:hypothetical protein n=1 Tax=Rhizobium meliloti TaxID=382 RepID=UPI000FDAC387|nr:hypothetical protein [Sinorhizobium meliloti]MCO6423649.1 hypothetical protein [Sinorhizobium meliloti]RVL39055.1 hypothetical protein CN148_08575 [Sinorhizobium meliloti]
MNSIAKISVIATLSALTFAGISQAASVEMNWPDRIDQTVRTFKGDNFRVVDVDTLSHQTRMRVDKATPGQRAALQAAVEANRPLLASLRARNVELDNVAAAKQAADGGLTIYLR